MTVQYATGQLYVGLVPKVLPKYKTLSLVNAHTNPAAQYTLVTIRGRN